MKRFLFLVVLMLFPALASGQTSQIPLQCKDTSGSPTAQSCTTVLTMGPVSGDSIIYTTTTGNTGDVTLNVDSKGAAHIRKWSGSSVLASGDLVANVPVQLIFDGTYWELQTIGNAPSGTGNVNAGSNLFTGGPVASSNNTTGVAASSAYLDCSQFSGADWTLKVQACLSALNTLNSTGGVADARGIAAGGTTGSVNPEGGTMPASGTLLLGPGTYSINVPFVAHGDWSVQGISTRGVDTSVGTTVKAGASFQATYTTGTITVGTPGASEVITGSGTTWTSNMIGCAFYGNNGATNSTGGIITAVGSATSLTLGWGWNNGTGAAGGSSYSIACAVYVLGSGGASAAGAIYGMGVYNMNFDCNVIAGCIGLLNYFGQQGTQGNNVAVHNSLNIGFDFENQIQNMGKWTNLLASMGTGCGAGALPVVIRGFSGGESFFGISGLSAGKGNCATTLTQDVDLEGNYVSMSALDMASAGIGVLLGGNVTCPVSCAVPGHMPSGNHIDNIYAESTVTTAVKISNTLGTGQSNQISQVTNLGTNALIDTANGCTETNSRLASYITTVTGVIGFSTSNISGCTSAYTQTIASGTAALGTGAIASGACNTTATAITATGTAATDTITYAANTDISGVTGYGSTSGFLTIYPYPGSNVVNFKVCNWTGSSITPSAVTLNWRVVR